MMVAFCLFLAVFQVLSIAPDAEQSSVNICQINARLHKGDAWTLIVLGPQGPLLKNQISQTLEPFCVALIADFLFHVSTVEMKPKKIKKKKVIGITHSDCSVLVMTD